MENKTEEFGEVQLYFVDQNTIEKVACLFPRLVVMEIEKGEAFGLAIEEEGEIRGALGATFDPENESLNILSIYVAKEARRRRLGATLLLQTIESVMEETGGELRAVTMGFLEKTEGVKELLETLGFEMNLRSLEGSFFLNKNILKNSLLFQKKDELSSKSGNVMSLAQLSEYDKNILYHQLEQEGIAYISPKELKEARGKLSFIKKDASNKIQACCIITGNKELVLMQFYSGNGNVKYGLEVLSASLTALLEEKEEWRLEIPCVSESSRKLLQKLVPEAAARNYIRAVLWV